MTKILSKKKIAILTTLGILIGGLGLGVPESDAGFGCTLNSPLTDPLVVLSVGTTTKFFTHIIEKEVFTCDVGIVDVTTIIQDKHNTADKLKSREVVEVRCVKDPTSSPIPNCTTNLITFGQKDTITLFDDCLDVDHTWVDGATATVDTGTKIIPRTVIVQKELWNGCIDGPIFEIFVIKSIIKNGPVSIDIVICEKANSAFILRCDQIIT